MSVAAKLDDYGRPAWIALAVAAFIVWWPLGLAVLLYLFGSGRMGCGMRGFGRFDMAGGEQRSRGGWSWSRGGTSGNRAFDDYREETLRRLEEEEREFRAFLDRLRLAKDRAEFDQFMAERRRAAEGPAAAEA